MSTHEPAPTVALNTDLTFAGAAADITPAQPVALAGAVGRTARHRHVYTRLQANAIVLRGAGEQLLLLAADLLYFGPELTAAVHRCAQRWGLHARQVVLAASHTHFAPATDRSKPLLGEVDDEYLAVLSRTLCALVDRVLGEQAVAVRMSLSRAAGEASVHRRRRWPLPTWTRAGLRLRPSIVMAPSPNGPRDAFADVLRLVDDAGQTRGLIWKLACHPVCFAQADSVCAEYPGQVRGALREEQSVDLPVVFLQGFSGDARPRLLGRLSWRERLRGIRAGPVFGEATLAQWQHWATGVAALVCRAARAQARPVRGGLHAAVTEVPMSKLINVRCNPDWADKALRIQRVAFGDDLEILALNAEVCSPYLGAWGAGARTLCVGYTGDVMGYLPSAQQAKEGGYEGGEFFRCFGLRGAFLPGFEETVLAAVQGLRGAGTGQSMSSSSG